MTAASKQITQFQKTIWDYYKKSGRELPWRKTRGPYKIFISEVMLQQTQVTSVLKKYPQFIKIFPNFSSLAKADTKKLLGVWQGLGYNRRALYLKKSAEIIMEQFKGSLPQDINALKELPGIGESTAGSILAFVFNKPAIFIETNIRRVYIHFFFKDKEGISDSQLIPILEKTLDSLNPRDWYYSLMDYGTMLKKTVENPNKKSKHYHIQSKFEGSDRQIRGIILKQLLVKPLNKKSLFSFISSPKEKTEYIIADLIQEGFIIKKGKVYEITR